MIHIEEPAEQDIIIEQEKEVLRKRLENSKPEDFKDWDDLKKSFKIKK